MMRTLLSWKNGLLALLVGLLSFGAFHWWKNVHPFFKIENATLSVLTLEVHSEEAGQLAHSSLDEGDSFQAGQSLFSLDSNVSMKRLQEIDRKIGIYRQQIEQTKSKVDQAMEQYLYLQKELTLVGKTSELLDQILEEAQKMQGHCFQIEKELFALQAERSEIEKAVSKRTFISDFEGVVLRRFKQMGDAVEAKEVVFLIANNQKRWVEAEIPEKMLTTVKIGSPGFIEFCIATHCLIAPR